MIPSETVLIFLRVLAGILLLATLGLVLIFLWRDFRGAAETITSTRRPYGKLTAIETIGNTSVLTGESHPLLALTSIGRSPSNAIQIEDSFASAEHALVALRDGQWWLEDRGSRNGTLLNDLPVTQPVIITNGDIIGIGQKHFRVELEN
ncbi:MAG: FHA domain-containing protein [Chloroflexi bacterium OLB15]|nr:MAG: FHA domain-containing protein [Chloroflexi bacterium OLB15]